MGTPALPRQKGRRRLATIICKQAVLLWCQVHAARSTVLMTRVNAGAFSGSSSSAPASGSRCCLNSQIRTPPNNKPPNVTPPPPGFPQKKIQIKAPCPPPCRAVRQIWPNIGRACGEGGDTASCRGKGARRASVVRPQGPETCSKLPQYVAESGLECASAHLRVSDHWSHVKVCLPDVLNSCMACSVVQPRVFHIAP